MTPTDGDMSLWSFHTWACGSITLFVFYHVRWWEHFRNEWRMCNARMRRTNLAPFLNWQTRHGQTFTVVPGDELSGALAVWRNSKTASLAFRTLHAKEHRKSAVSDSFCFSFPTQRRMSGAAWSVSWLQCGHLYKTQSKFMTPCLCKSDMTTVAKNNNHKKIVLSNLGIKFAGWKENVWWHQSWQNVSDSLWA